MCPRREGDAGNSEPRNTPTLQSPRLSEQFMGRGPSLQQMALGQLNVMCKRMKSDPYLTLFRKPNSVWIKDVNVKD